MIIDKKRGSCFPCGDYPAMTQKGNAESNNAYREPDLELARISNTRRNPYLVNYQAYRNGREHTQSRNRTGQRTAERRRSVQSAKAGRERAMNPQVMAERRRSTKNTAGSGRTVNRQTVRAQAVRPQTARTQTVRPLPDVRNRSGIMERRGYGTLQAAQKRRERLLRQKPMFVFAAVAGLCIVAAILLFRIWNRPYVDGSTLPDTGQQALALNNGANGRVQGINAKVFGKHPSWTEDFLTPNEYSRPGDELKEVKSIFVHYTANKGTSAAQNRSYFEQLKDTRERSASAHFIIGYDGEILQCIPLDEIAYAVQTRNGDSISIECCYLEPDGSFTQETYDSLIALLKWLTEAYGLDTEDILRHYDCGGKKCPIYYTEHEDAWEQLKKDVKAL